jgi:hypothetical protein
MRHTVKTGTLGGGVVALALAIGLVVALRQARATQPEIVQNAECKDDACSALFGCNFCGAAREHCHKGGTDNIKTCGGAQNKTCKKQGTANCTTKKYPSNAVPVPNKPGEFTYNCVNACAGENFVNSSCAWDSCIP